MNPLGVTVNKKNRIPLFFFEKSEFLVNPRELGKSLPIQTRVMITEKLLKHT